MKMLETHPLWLEKQRDFCELIHYLKDTLQSLQIISAIVFGSIVRREKTASPHSDIDIVAYSPVFTREIASEHVAFIQETGGDFLDKVPLFLEDFISPRIEFFLRLGETIFDINLFPAELSGYSQRYINATHDSLDVVIGAMYTEAWLLFGEVPFAQLIETEFLPFYCDELRKARMDQLEKRIHAGLRKIRDSIDNGQEDLLYQIYKTRTYLIKWMFINARKYPVDYSRYLHRQLTEIIGLSEEATQSLLLSGDSLAEAYSLFVDTASQIISQPKI